MSFNRRHSALAAGVLAIGALSGCAGDSTASDEPAGTTAACAITVSDSWVKATDTEMTGAFGELTNTSDVEMVVVSASSPLAGKMEIHEVVDKDGSMVMQPLEGGLVIPAGGTATLAPGQDHLMLMGLTEPIEAGQTVDITMTCADGGTASYSGVAKPFEGGAEDYQPGMEMDSSASPSS